MKKIGSCGLYFVFVFFFSFFVKAEDISVEATVDRTEMFTSDTFTVTVTVKSKGGVSVGEPKLPDLKEFDFLRSWSGSTMRSTFVNGKFVVERAQAFNFMLAPRAHGDLTMGAFTVDVNGKAFSTLPIKLKVKKGEAPQQRLAKPPAQKRQRGVNPFSGADEVDDMFEQLLRRRQRPSVGQNLQRDDIDSSDHYFIDLEVDKSSVYVGEQITASWSIYVRQNLTDIQNIKFPDLKGFWKEDIEVATGLRWSNVVVNGVVFRKALLASYALFPIKPGNSVIDAYKVKCKFVMPGILGFRKSDYITRGSTPKTVEVKPLPIQGKPKNFTGAVGQFKVTASANTQTVKQNQPVEIKIKFSGQGNAKRINLPDFEFPEGIELYDTKDDSKFFKSGKSYKQFDLLIIPRVAGDIVLPSMSVGLFDPATGQYYEKNLPEFKIQVEPSTEGQNLAEERFQEKAEEGKEQWKLSEPQLILAYQQADTGISNWPLIVFLAFVLASILFLVWYSMMSFGVFDKKYTLDSNLRKRMSELNSKASKGLWRDVGVDGSNMIFYFLGEASGQGGGSERADRLLQKAPPSLRKECGDEIIKLLSQFETIGFAPEGVVGKYKESKELKSLVKQLDKLFNRAVNLVEGKGQA